MCVLKLSGIQNVFLAMINSYLLILNPIKLIFQHIVYSGEELFKVKISCGVGIFTLNVSSIDFAVPNLMNT